LDGLKPTALRGLKKNTQQAPVTPTPRKAWRAFVEGQARAAALLLRSGA